MEEEGGEDKKEEAEGEGEQKDENKQWGLCSTHIIAFNLFVEYIFIPRIFYLSLN